MKAWLRIPYLSRCLPWVPALFCCVVSTTCLAEDPDIVAIGWLDNFTYGGVNTAIGLPVALAGWAWNAVQGRAPGLHIDETGQQLVFENSSFLPGREYSTGAVHHANWDGRADAHEAGHAKQSAAMGPLFMPLVGLSYALRGFDEGPIEELANEWRNLGQTMRDGHPLKLRFEIGQDGGRGVRRVGANFALLERDSRVRVRVAGEDNPTAIAYKYGEVGVTVGVSGTCPASKPLKFEVAPFQKEFLAEWATLSSAIRLMVDSKEDTGVLSVDIEKKRIDAKFLSQLLGLGVRVGDRKVVAVDASGKVAGSLQGLWLIGKAEGQKNPGMLAVGGAGAEVRAHVLDWVEPYASRMRYWGTGGYRRNVDTIGAETPALFSAESFTSSGESGNPTKLQVGAKYSDETESFSVGAGQKASQRIKMTVFTFGGRF